MEFEQHLCGKVRLANADSRDALKHLADNSIDAVVTDPPYALVSIVKRFGKDGSAPAKGNEAYARASAGFMGQTWDTGETAFAVEFWAEVMRVLKPGGHVVAASGTRTYHRLAVAIEDAGFEIRDMVSWLYGTGFPKSHDVSKGIDRAAGAERELTREGTVKRDAYGEDWDTGSSNTRPRYDEPATKDAALWSGWGTALKPACEPWVLARKPLGGTVAANVLAHGTGALNIDGCRVGTERRTYEPKGTSVNASMIRVPEHRDGMPGDAVTVSGRWPANVIHDGSDEVVEAFGEPQRFFYSAKASKADRAGSKHPTVKPISLMRYLCRLVTPPGGVILDPFAGTGTTGQAAYLEGFEAVLVEREPEFADDIRRRMKLIHAATSEIEVAVEVGDETPRAAGQQASLL